MIIGIVILLIIFSSSHQDLYCLLNSIAIITNIGTASSSNIPYDYDLSILVATRNDGYGATDSEAYSGGMYQRLKRCIQQIALFNWYQHLLYISRIFASEKN